ARAGGDPQGAGVVEHQRHDGVRGQAAGIVGVVPVVGDAAVGREVVQPTGVVAEPDVVAAAGDGEHVVAAHLRVVGLAVVAEAGTVAVEHAQAAVLGGHPDPVAGVDVHELDVVAGQRTRVVRLVPPYAHGQAVVAGQAVPGGDPDVAVAVAGEAEEVGGRQALPGTDDAQARGFRHGRVGGGRRA